MKKRYKRTTGKMMRRSARVFLNDLNPGKRETLTEFLYRCHAATQYFIDLFWQRQDFSADLADLPTVHRGRDRFNLTTRLAQALAKQAKETARSAHEHDGSKPQLRHHTVTLYSHFVHVEPFRGQGFDWAVNLIGSGAPRMVLPIHSTKVINTFLDTGWEMGKAIRLGLRKGRLFIDFLFDKARPQQKTEGAIVGMDSNYRNGLVFSDGQQTGQGAYDIIRSFPKRKKYTHASIKSLMGQAIKQIDFSTIRVLCVENLKKVKHDKRGTFPRTLNRRLSHWLYAYLCDVLTRRCEEHGVKLERKSPAYTSQFCRQCQRWDRRNRKGDKFSCVHCGFSDHADLNAAKNLELLGLAGAYGLGSLQPESVQ